MELVVGQGREGCRGRRQSQAGHEIRWPERRLTVVAHQAMPGPTSLCAGHLLLKDRGEQHVEHGLRTAQPHAGKSAGESADATVGDTCEVADTGRTCVHADDASRPLQNPVGSGPVSFDTKSIAILLQYQRCRPVRRPGGPQGPPGCQADGPVALAADQGTQGEGQVQWSIQG